jgi:hypothetical protein
MAMEDFEYLKRKTVAGILFIISLIMLIVSGFLIGTGLKHYSFLFSFGLILFIGFSCIAIYCAYLLEKISHVVWTKQAIREMKDKELKAGKDFFIKNKSYSNIRPTQIKTCKQCNRPINPSDSFCSECGKKIVNDFDDIICPNCNEINDISNTFCLNCGNKLKG